MGRIEDETPQLVGGQYVRLLVEVRRCLECGLPLQPSLGGSDPKYHAVMIKAQWKRAGWPEAGPYISSREGYVCKPCAEKGLAKWTCALCKEERIGEPQEEIGWPRENLCKPCFETVPAKQWEEAKERLEKRHEYDFG